MYTRRLSLAAAYLDPGDPLASYLLGRPRPAAVRSYRSLSGQSSAGDRFWRASRRRATSAAAHHSPLNLPDLAARGCTPGASVRCNAAVGTKKCGHELISTVSNHDRLGQPIVRRSANGYELLLPSCASTSTRCSPPCVSRKLERCLLVPSYARHTHAFFSLTLHARSAHTHPSVLSPSIFPFACANSHYSTTGPQVASARHEQ